MAMIKMSHPAHPAIFKQTRFSLRGKTFTIIKFRTMVPNAEKLKKELTSLSVDKGKGFKIVNDPRVTRIGRSLRRTYLDELPQLSNVLKGDMSIVGPRANSYPPSTYEPWQMKRLEVRHGLTGDWQISKGKTYDFRERRRIDNNYVNRTSISYDALIVWKTIRVCLFERSGV
jgi:lipopolysaccharide/colanic/teichoic acid biosynthesis glycosyltransferase